MRSIAEEDREGREVGVKNKAGAQACRLIDSFQINLRLRLTTAQFDSARADVLSPHSVAFDNSPACRCHAGSMCSTLLSASFRSILDKRLFWIFRAAPRRTLRGHPSFPMTRVSSLRSRRKREAAGSRSGRGGRQFRRRESRSGSRRSRSGRRGFQSGCFGAKYDVREVAEVVLKSGAVVPIRAQSFDIRREPSTSCGAAVRVKPKARLCEPWVNAPKND